MPTERKWLVLAALLAWLGVVIVGSGERTPDTALLGVDNVGTAFLLVLALLALAGLVLIVVLNPFRGGWTEPEKRRNGTGFLLFLALALLVWQPDLLDGFVPDEEPTQEGTVTDQLDLDGGLADEGPAETVAQATDLMLLAAAIGLVIVVWYLVRRRNADAPELATAEEMFEADLAAAIEQAGAELADSTDPRESVLRAYAILEVSLAEHGYRRDRSETTTEHVQRALRNLRVDPSPVVQLGALYEVARFSDAPVTVDDQQRAAHALGLARAELLVHA